MMKYHTLGGLKQHKFISSSSGAEKSKIKVPADSVSGESSLPGLQMVAFCVLLWWKVKSGAFSYSYKDPGPIRLGSTLMTSCNLYCLLTDPISRCLSSVYCNKAPYTGWLKQQKFMSCSLGGWKS